MTEATDTEAYTLTPEDEELLSYVPAEDRPRLAARLAGAPDNAPRTPRPDRTQGSDPRPPATPTEATEAKRGLAALLFAEHAQRQLGGGD